MEPTVLRDKMRFFSGLSAVGEEGLGLLLHRGVFLQVRTGRVLTCQSEPPEAVYLVVGGSVKRIKYRADESSIVLGRSRAGDWLGVCEAVLGSPYLSDSVTEGPAEILRFSRGGFHSLLDKNGFRSYFLEHAARSFYLLHAQIERNLPLSRLVHYLIVNGKEDPGSPGALLVRTTQDRLAGSIGVTRETVNRHLNELQRLGFLRIGRGFVEVEDPAALERYLEE